MGGVRRVHRDYSAYDNKCLLNQIQSDLWQLTSSQATTFSETSSPFQELGASYKSIYPSVSFSAFLLDHSTQSWPLSSACHSTPIRPIFRDYHCQHSRPPTPSSPAQVSSLATAFISFFFSLLPTIFPMMLMPATSLWAQLHFFLFQISLNIHFFKKTLNVNFLVRHFFLCLLPAQAHKKKMKKRNHE